jgi:hypothetical protein
LLYMSCLKCSKLGLTELLLSERMLRYLIEARILRIEFSVKLLEALVTLTLAYL